MRSTRVLARGLSAAIMIGLLAGCGDQPQEQTQTPESRKQSTTDAASGLPNFTGLVQQAAPGVVNISAAPSRGNDNRGRGEPQAGERSLQDWLQRFFEQDKKERNGGPPSRAKPSMGSGLIISEDGYILTSRHVVQGESRIVVKLNDRRQMTAELVGSDKYSDIALLKIDADNLEPADIGSADDLAPGAWVVAIGSPFGFETSVTAGIVSAKRRTLASDQYVPFIQTDVAINPGNSGGPLFNLNGKVVGVNAQIYSRSGGFQGVSFAIPIDTAMDAAEQLKDGGSVTRGWLGVQIQEVDLALAESFDMQQPHGALVAHVVPDTPAADSPLQAGDVIVEYDGRRVPSAAALPPMVGVTNPGETVEIGVLRDGDRQTLEVEVGKLDAKQVSGKRQAQPQSKPRQSPEVQLGLRMRGLDDSEREQLGVPEGGIRILEVAAGPARQAGLKAGDVIVAVGASRVADPAALRARLAESDGPVALRVLRDGNARYMPFEPGT